MKKQDVLEILRAVESGRLGAEEAFTKLKLAPFEDIGFAKVDHHREMRQGVAEVIYGAGKTAGADRAGISARTYARPRRPENILHHPHARPSTMRPSTTWARDSRLSTTSRLQSGRECGGGP